MNEHLVKGADFEIYSLSVLMDKLSNKALKRLLSGFKPYKDGSTSEFLKTHAISMEKKDLSRTYLAIRIRDNRILGFVTVSIKCLSIPDGIIIPETIRSSIFIDSKTNVVQAFLLAQLARSESAPAGFGKLLMDIAMSIFEQAKEMVGCRIVRLDCTDELVDYYKNNDYSLIRKNDDGTLNQMLAFIKPTFIEEGMMLDLLT